MPVPSYDQLMRPALDFYSDGLPMSMSTICTKMADFLKLTQEQKDETLPKAKRTYLYDRTSWALVYLRQAGLLESIKPGVNKITEQGKNFLASHTGAITLNDLRVFPEFVAFTKKRSPSTSAPSVNPTSSVPKQPLNTALSSLPTLTPEDIIESAYETLRNALAQDVLDRVKQMPPAFFERLIVQLMLSLGYGSDADAGQTLGQTGDGGVDGVINQDKLGLDKIYLQAKRWTTRNVGSPDISTFVGALNHKNANKGVFITTSTFTQSALDFAKNTHTFKISLIDGDELARLMIDRNLGVALAQNYEIKRIDSDFFAADGSG